jgi:membrane protein implicated in regulation of membrane protease activity
MISQCSCSSRHEPLKRYSGRMPAAVVWLIFAFGLAGAEALTGDMFLLMLGGGALAAAAASWLSDWPNWADGAVFLVVSVALVVLVRPALRRRLVPAKSLRTGVEALEGRSALVLDRVAHGAGQVKLDGQVWTARPFNDGDSYEPGESVTVMHIDGATAVVWKSG